MCKRLLYFIIFTYCFGLFNNLTAQNIRIVDSTDFELKKDLIDLLISLKITDTSESKSLHIGSGIRVSLLPTVSGIPGDKGSTFITAFNAAFFLGNSQTTHLSNVFFTPYTNFNGRFVFPIRSYIWSKDNTWNFIGDYRYLITQEYTFGLGSGSKFEDRTRIEFNHLRFYQSVLRNLFSYVLLGGGFHYDYHFNISELSEEASKRYMELYNSPPLSTYNSTGFSISSAFDSRVNSLNPQQGMYAGVTYRYTPTWMNSTFNWQSIYADIKLYHSFNRKRQNIISFWSFYWDVFKGTAPYLDLPATFWDPNYRAGRGYSQGRFRGDAMAYVESEYRFDITKNGLWGATVFANAQSLRNPRTGKFERIAPAIGSGLRLKFNKFSNTNLTLDVGFGRDGMNYLFGLGEFF